MAETAFKQKLDIMSDLNAQNTAVRFFGVECVWFYQYLLVVETLGSPGTGFNGSG